MQLHHSTTSTDLIETMRLEIHLLRSTITQLNALIKRENPEMTDAQIAFTLAKMKDSGIVDSGQSLTKGIGAMSHERISGFYAKMSKAGVVRPGLELSKGYTLDFVNRGVGLELRPKN
jgi:NitT/TauT family transport system substrate-binding protein